AIISSAATTQARSSGVSRNQTRDAHEVIRTFGGAGGGGGVVHAARCAGQEKTGAHSAWSAGSSETQSQAWRAGGRESSVADQGGTGGILRGSFLRRRGPAG